MADVVLRDEVGPGIVCIRLNRPEVHNAFDLEMLLAFEKTLDGLAAENPRVVILTGTGRSFCSGADLNDLRDADPPWAEQWCFHGHRVLAKLEDLPCPTIAALNGNTVGGGLELACTCDLRYAMEGSLLGYPEARLGMITGWGGTFRFPLLVGPAVAKELIFTGRLVTANEAKAIGLVNDVFTADEFETRVNEVAHLIAANAPVAVQLAKRMLNRSFRRSRTAANEEALALARCMTTRDQREGVEAFFQKRQPRFRGE